MTPLADKIRPTRLSEFIGQPHLIGEGKPLTIAIQVHTIQSLIFWGPPGSGKTTLARILASAVEAEFFHLSAVSAGKNDVRKVVEEAKKYQTVNKKTILFLDEIHRFNKAQQDFLLPFVEDGTIVLIGATTENPSFEVISPLLSRSQVYVLKPHTEDDLKKVVLRGAKELGVKIPPKPLEFLVTFANGDARKALNLLESTASLYSSITVETLSSTLQSPYLRYDQTGEEHYDTISAFIKSMRASQVDAALYYLARMVVSGEDPLFIARRMVIFASEDIGVAVPTALVVANAVFRSCETIGYPECQLNLAHGVVYLCQCKKNRSANDAFFSAMEDVKKYGNLEIPLRIRNLPAQAGTPTKLMKDLSYGKGYKRYDKESYLPEKLKGKSYYDHQS